MARRIRSAGHDDLPHRLPHPPRLQRLRLPEGNPRLAGQRFRQADQPAPWTRLLDADFYSVTGRINGELYGNPDRVGANDRVYSDATGRLIRATIDRGTVITVPFLVQDLNYSYDLVGNPDKVGAATKREELFHNGILLASRTATATTGSRVPQFGHLAENPRSAGQQNDRGAGNVEEFSHCAHRLLGRP